MVDIVSSDGERLDPAILSFVIKAAAAAQQVRMRKLEESKIPIGEKSFQIDVTDSITEIPFLDPLISYSITNKRGSAGSIYVAINEMEGPMDQYAEIEPGESISRDFGYPTVSKLFFQAYTGLTATVKIYGEVGKWE